jgi:WD40 repeat protein
LSAAPGWLAGAPRFEKFKELSHAEPDYHARLAQEHQKNLRGTLAGHRKDVNGCAISPDGMLIASASNDRTLKIWMASSGECVTTLHVDGGLADCPWLADGERVAATGAGGVYFFSLSRRS